MNDTNNKPSTKARTIPIFQKGDRVSVTKGALAGATGIVGAVRNKANISIEIRDKDRVLQLIMPQDYLQIIAA